MRKYVSISMLLILLLLTSCSNKPKERDTEESTLDTSTIENSESINTANSPASDAQADLLTFLEGETSEEIISFVYDDFEGNGEHAVFAFVGKQDTAGIYYGEIWFVNKDAANKLAESDWYQKVNQVIEAGTKKLVVSEQLLTSSTLSMVWGVKDRGVYEETISGLVGELYAEDGDLFGVHSEYDATSDGSGHTYKKYYYYWDDGIKEYGGITISESDLLAFEGASEILDSIKSAGNDISKILFRGNNIININYTDGYQNNNATLYCHETSVEFVEVNEWGGDELGKSSYGGIYLPALDLTIAEYPDAFSYPNK